MQVCVLYVLNHHNKQSKLNSRNSDYSSTWSNSSGQRNRSGSLSVDLSKTSEGHTINKPFERRFGNDEPHTMHDNRARTMSISVHDLNRSAPQYPPSNVPMQHVSVATCNESEPFFVFMYICIILFGSNQFR